MPTPHAPSRRSVVRAAAWTAPAVSVAVAAPAYAACSPSVVDGTYQVQWARDYNASTKRATAVRVGTATPGTPGTTPIGLSVSSRFFGSVVAASTTANEGTYNNLAVSPANIGGTGTRGLTIMQRSTAASLSTPRLDNRQEVLLTFDRPVRDLRFKLTDIDSQDPQFSNGQYQDRVFVSGTPTSTKASQVIGSGWTSGDSWRPTGPNLTQDPRTGTNGNVDVSYVGQPASMTYLITYWNDQSGRLAGQGLQGVFLTDLSFTAASCV